LDYEIQHIEPYGCLESPGCTPHTADTLTTSPPGCHEFDSRHSLHTIPRRVIQQKYQRVGVSIIDSTITLSSAFVIDHGLLLIVQEIQG